MSAKGGAERARRVEADLAASSPRSGADGGDGSAEWDEWYRRDYGSRTLAQDFTTSTYDQMRRSFLAGWAARGGAS